MRPAHFFTHSLFLSLFFIHSIATPSFAKPTKETSNSKVYLTKEEFKALSHKKKVLIIKAYREALYVLNQVQNKTEMQYELPGRSSDTASVLKILFLPLAISDWNEGSRCIFAGYISKVYKNASNKLVCQFPRGAEKGCKSGQMHCNPVFYGATSSCVPIGNNSTASCDQNGTPIQDLATSMTEDAINEWLKNQQAVLDACKDKDIQLRQKSVCTSLITKIDYIKRMQVPSAVAEAAPAATDSVAASLQKKINETSEMLGEDSFVCTSKIEKANYPFSYLTPGTEIGIQMVRSPNDSPLSQRFTVRVMRKLQGNAKESAKWVLLEEFKNQHFLLSETKSTIRSDELSFSGDHRKFGFNINCNDSNPKCNLYKSGVSASDATALSTKPTVGYVSSSDVKAACDSKLAFAPDSTKESSEKDNDSSRIN